MSTVYRLTLSYHGAAYAGWQRQTNALTVQQVVEEALADLLGPAIRIHGSGRTDAGVHARGQVAHFESPIDPTTGFPKVLPLRGLVHGTNHRLPPDIRILAADRMCGAFHARKSAIGKEYRYRIYRGRVVPPLDAPFVKRVERSLDLVSLRQALAKLPGRHDFTAFALQGGSHTQPFRRLFAATAVERGRELELRFVGEGFLRGMVRSLAGTLIEVGLGQRAPESMDELLQGRPRDEAGPTAAAEGLVLQRVFYGPECRTSEHYGAG